MPRLTPFLLFLAAVTMVAGCGDESGNGNAGDKASSNASQNLPLTKAEFIRKAEAICEKADEAQYEEAKKYVNAHAKELNRLEPIPREEQTIRAIEFPSIKKQIEEIRALGAPEGEAKKVDAILSGFEAALRKAHKNPYAIEGEIPRENPFRPIAFVAGEYGFNACTSLI